MVVAPELLSGLNAKQLRELARNLIAQVACRDQAISARELQISERDQQIASLDPVSYTHLDVYKRQFDGCLTRNRRCTECGNAMRHKSSADRSSQICEYRGHRHNRQLARVPR